MKRLSLVLAVLLVVLASGCEAGMGGAVGESRTRSVDNMEMVYIPGGEYVVGSDDSEVDAALALCQATYEGCERALFEDEQPAHSVALDGFWIDRTEVTNAQYHQCVEAGVCSDPACGDDEALNSDDQPVVCVTWFQARIYCEWAEARLPTEAEWEVAARGPGGQAFPWGDTFESAALNYCDANCEYNWADVAGDDGYLTSAPVGSYPAGRSWCGADDMAGNVWEWVADWYGEYGSERQEGPAGPEEGSHNVVRGGGWDQGAAYVRSAMRNWGFPDRWSRVTGFRCAAP